MPGPNLSFTYVLAVDSTFHSTTPDLPLRTDGTQTVRTTPTTPYLFHPDHLTKSQVPNAGTIKNGETVKIECVDWTGGQIKNNDSADDIRDVDLTKIHYLTGPFEIETAEPGDVLVVDIQDVQPLEDSPWGFTGIFSKKNGGRMMLCLLANHPCN